NCAASSGWTWIKQRFSTSTSRRSASMAARWSRLSVSTASPARTISCCKSWNCSALGPSVMAILPCLSARVRAQWCNLHTTETLRSIEKGGVKGHARPALVTITQGYRYILFERFVLIPTSKRGETWEQSPEGEGGPRGTQP